VNLKNVKAKLFFFVYIDRGDVNQFEY